MNTMEVTKIVAGLCATLLIFLLINFFTEFLYASEGGHGGEVHNVYEIATGEAHEGGETGGEVEQIDVEALMAAADPAEGEGEFKPCAACHKLEPGVNAVGPSLFGVVGRDIGSVDGFAYSDDMATHEGSWTPDNLIHFLENPKAFAPGTKMAFRGIRDAQDRANLVAYLDSLDN
jgi:cytochrome c